MLYTFMRFHAASLALADLALAGLVLASASVYSTPVAAQATNPAYIAEMPSVDKVKAAITGSDPTDTLARQVAVFGYLSQFIQRMKYHRGYSVPFTPDEQRVKGSYDLAAYQISQDYEKSHTPDQAKAFLQLHGRYEMNSEFYKDWYNRLLSQSFRAQYEGAMGEEGAHAKAHFDAERRQYEQDTARQQAPESGPSNGARNDPGSVAVRRCMELGGTELSCLGKGLMTGILDMAGVDPDALTGPKPAGPVLNGRFKSRAANTSLSFGADTVTIENCGDLVPESSKYSLTRRGSEIHVSIPNKSGSIEVAMGNGPDLNGPAAVQVTGRVISGHHNVWMQAYANGTPVVGGACGSTCGYWANVIDYAPKTARCSLGQLSPTQPAGKPGDVPGALGYVMSSLVSDPGPTGLRMIGRYTGPSGLAIDFAPDSVTLDCAQSHSKQLYVVTNGASVLVSVNNTGGPFTLTLQPDGSLSGNGTATVVGRLVSGSTDASLTYADARSRCELGRLVANGGRPSADITQPAPMAASTGRPQPTPAPERSTAGNASLSIVSGFPPNSNPLAGRVVVLMSERFDNALRQAGVAIPASATPAQAIAAWGQGCKPPTDCRALAASMEHFFVGRVTLDSTGRGTIDTRLLNGNLYAMTSGKPGSGQPLLWDLKLDVKPGPNSIILNASNAEPLH